MKRYQIQVSGKEYTVEIDDVNASPVTVKVNGKPFTVTIREQRPVGAPAAVQAEVQMVEPYVPAVTPTFVDVAAEPEPAAAEVAPAPSEGGEAISAPMPGTILDIAVQVGDRVQPGDTLCNLEAMKMKSPIRSPSEGTVVKILISEGQNVSYGEVLFTLG